MRLSTAVALAALLAVPALAEEREPAAGEGSGSPTTPPPTLSLDRLLKVPSGASYARGELRGGRDREDWSRLFVTAGEDVATLEAQIETNQTRLREIAPEDWGFSPTGGGPPADPEVARLRAELRRDRQSLETAQRRLRDLEIEASLAGVPDDWKLPEEDIVAPE